MTKSTHVAVRGGEGANKSGEGKKPSAPWIAAMLISAAALGYVFGIGPMFWLVHHEMIGADFCLAVYRPVLQICERSEWLGACCDSYLELWIGPPMGA